MKNVIENKMKCEAYNNIVNKKNKIWGILISCSSLVIVCLLVFATKSFSFNEININNVASVSSYKFDGKVEEVKDDIVNDLNIKVGNEYNKKTLYKIYVKVDNEFVLNSYQLFYETDNSLENYKSTYIKWSLDSKPIRDYYFDLDGKKSYINGKCLNIYSYEDSYMVLFEYNGINYDIETTNVGIDELVGLLESIIG